MEDGADFNMRVESIGNAAEQMRTEVAHHLAQCEMTVAQLAEQAGIPRETIEYLLRSSGCDFPLDDLVEIAHALGCKLNIAFVRRTNLN